LKPLNARYGCEPSGDRAAQYRARGFARGFNVSMADENAYARLIRRMVRVAGLMVLSVWLWALSEIWGIAVCRPLSSE